MATTYLLVERWFSRYSPLHQTISDHFHLLLTSPPSQRPAPPCIALILVTIHFHLLLTFPPSRRPAPPCIVLILATIYIYMSYTLYCSATGAFLCIHFLVHSTTGSSWHVQIPTRNHLFDVFAESIRPCPFVFIPVRSVSSGALLPLLSVFALFVYFFPPRCLLLLSCTPRIQL